MNHSQKVCPVEVQRQMDPYYRDIGSERCDMGESFCAVLEFVLQFPVEQRIARPVVESMAIRSDDILLISGQPFGTGAQLEKHLREWAFRTGITGMDADPYKVESFNAMLSHNIGHQEGIRSISI